MKYKHLTSEQRYYIYLERQKGSTRKSIAEAIGVSESTISRELRRNGGKNGSYNFMKAQEKADERSHRSPGNRAKPASLVWRVKQLIMDEQWSPSQISGYLHEK
jgi:IS30 family transposase